MENYHIQYLIRKRVIKIIITNDFDIPEALYNVIVSGIQKPSANIMRVSELVNPPLIKQLRLKYWDKIEVDASDFLWAVLGRSVHYILEKGTPENAIGEERISVDTKWGTLSGQSDLYHKEGIEDWKVTSVFSFLLGVKDEWIAQLNLYKFLWESNGFPVRTLKINAILRDWQRRKAIYDLHYPQIPFMTLRAPFWNQMGTMEYIEKRFAIHSLGNVECTPAEKWERPTTYAVMKKKAKRATRVLSTEIEAKEYIDNMKNEKVRPNFEVQKREGEIVRCQDYCDVNKFCPYYKGE